MACSGITVDLQQLVEVVANTLAGARRVNMAFSVLVSLVE